MGIMDGFELWLGAALAKAAIGVGVFLAFVLLVSAWVAIMVFIVDPLKRRAARRRAKGRG